MKYNFFGCFYIIAFSIANYLKFDEKNYFNYSFLINLINFFILYEILTYINHYFCHLMERNKNFIKLHGIHHTWTRNNGLASLRETFHDFLIYYIIGPLISELNFKLNIIFFLSSHQICKS